MTPERSAVEEVKRTEAASQARPAARPGLATRRLTALLDTLRDLMIPRTRLGTPLPSQRIRAHQVTLRRRYRRPQPLATPTIRRFDVHQRLQHFLMFSSFIVLAITGLPQKFSTNELSQWWIGTLGGLDNVRMIHHIAGFTMLADCLYHVLYLFYRVGIQGKLEPLRMIPTLKDVEDAVQSFAYFLGMSKEKPRFDRFSYLEKFDYWAVFWGIAMIGTSGLILAFPAYASHYIPGEAIRLAQIAHSEEALLAVGWIAVVHLFYVHLAPHEFPFNTSIFTGNVPRRHYKELHPLEYERIVAAEGALPVRATRIIESRRRRRRLPVA